MWLNSENDAWAEVHENHADIEIFTKGLHWNTGSKSRTILYNIKVPIVGNNVDICLFDSSGIEITTISHMKKMILSPELYLALGELKGGIDPAGADEHWKTARTALDRIKKAFLKSKKKPYIFFAGAAIESRMAMEIWTQLRKGVLSNAANLTNDQQTASLVAWLCDI
jgi:hypothetical protein